MDVREEARRLYEQDGLGLKEIAERLGLNPATIRKWKQRERWVTAQCHVTQNVTLEKPDDLTDAQEDFCQAYARTFNATSAYLQSHSGGTYRSAMPNGSRMLHVPKIRERIEQLKTEKAAAIGVSQGDVVELYMRIAFADLGQYADWEDDSIWLLKSSGVDGQIVKKVAKTKGGISIELVDKQKALDFLASYFLMNPMDQHKVAFDNKRLEIEEKKLTDGDPNGDDDHVVVDYGD